MNKQETLKDIYGNCYSKWFEKYKKNNRMKKLSQEDKEKVKQIIIDIFDFGNEPNDNTRLSMDLGLDELDLVELVMEIEKKFDCSIPDKVWDKVKIVSDIYDCLEKL